MKKYTSIIVTGSISWDIIMDFPHKFADYFHAEKLHQINISFAVDSLEKQMGGTATNIAYGASQAKKLFSPSSSGLTRGSMDSPSESEGGNDVTVHILGGLGKDGKEHLALFKKNGISSKGIVINKTKFSAHGSVITDMKDNQIWGFYYGACEDGKRVDLKKYVNKKSLLIISANHPDAFLATQEYAIKNNIDYLYDAGMSLTWIKNTDLQKGVMNATYLIGNDYEIAMITKRLKITVNALVKKGINVITTLGAEGVRLDSVVESIAVLVPAAVNMKKVIDPTGAGDAWRGGFVMAYTAGYKISDCLKIGNVGASFAIEHYGTVNYQISKKEFEKRLKSLDV